jgi:hypothetical protein
MKKETIFLLLFWGAIAVVLYFVIKTLRQTNAAIKVSKS